MKCRDSSGSSLSAEVTIYRYPVYKRLNLNFLTHIMPSQDISCFENSVDPDQLASQLPADQEPHFFDSACKYILVTVILQVN